MRSSLTPESEFSASDAGTFVTRGTKVLEHASSIELPRGAVYSQYIEVGDSIQITALNGTGWITMEGDPEDYVLERDTASIFTGPGLLVIEGLSDTNSFTVDSLQGT